MSALVDRIENLNSDLSNTDPQWVQYVMDHYQEIKHGAETIGISPEHMFRYKYRPESYLKSLQMDPSMAWIMLSLNQLTTNLDFSMLTSVLIPDQEQLIEYREQFEASQITHGEATKELYRN